MLPVSSNTQPPPRRKRNWQVIGAVIGVIALIALVVIGAIVNDNSSNASSSSSTSTSASASPTTSTSAPATSSVKAAATECPDTTPLNFDRNAPADGNLVPVKDNSKHAVETDEDVQQAIKDNPKILAGWAKKLWPQKYPDSDNWKQFVADNGNGKCLNEKGQKALDNILALLTADSTEVDENAQASPDMVNSFMGENGVRSYAEGGITGDLSAVEYTLPNGKKVTVLKRCGNFADHGKSFPPGNPPPGISTPPPPPPPPTTTPPPICVGCEPPPVCPPGTIGVPPNCIPVCTECCTPEECPPPPVCPPGMHGTPPACKDDHTNGPGQVVDVPQRPNPLPARPDLAEPTTPDVPRPTVPYTPPAPAPVTPVPQDQGGPTAIPTPRETPTPEAEAPTEEEPEEACIPAPGMPC